MLLLCLSCHPCKQLHYLKFCGGWKSDLETQAQEDLSEQTDFIKKKSGSIAGNKNLILWADNTDGAKHFGTRGII